MEAMNGVIFDFNGTMLYDEELQEESWRQFIKEKTGRGISGEEFQEYIHGRNVGATLTYFLERELSKEEIVRLGEEKERIYRGMCLESDDFQLAKGLPAFLDELKRRGVSFTIATAAAIGNVRFYFEKLELGKWFDMDRLVYNDGSFPGKPEPDVYLRAARAIGKEACDCIVFEDARAGIEAAQRAKAGKIVGVASMLDEEELDKLGVTMTIHDYSDTERLCELL